MMRQTILLVACSYAMFSGARLVAQCGGNGANGALSCDPLTLGRTVTTTIQGAPGQGFLYYFAANRAPNVIPGVGQACLSLSDPSLTLLAQGALDFQGRAATSIPIPNDPALLPFVGFAQAGVGDPAAPSGVAITPALRVDFELPDSYVSVSPLGAPRGLSSSTLLMDGRVLLAGGGAGTLLSPVQSDSTELYDPTTRTWSPGPTMGLSRVLHTASILDDGRVLMVGGMFDSAGNVTASCELFDPISGAFSPAAPMGTVRAGHTATRLPDGRVLVAGGTSNLTLTSATNFTAILNASQDTAEIYDPVTDTWTAVPGSMTAPRFLSSAIGLANGDVLLVSGLTSGISTLVFGVTFTIPVWTETCDRFSLTTGAISAVAALPSGQGRSVPGIATLPNGDVWLVGGAISMNNAATSVDESWIFDGAAWAPGPTLPSAVSSPAVVPLADGDILVAGGVTGSQVLPGATSDARVYDGTTLSAAVSLPAPRGGLSAIRLLDGSVILAGGNDAGTNAQADSWLYYPSP